MGPDSFAQTSDAVDRAAVLYRGGRYADAAGQLRRALDAAPDSARVMAAITQMVAAARHLLTNGQAELARSVLAPLAESGRASDDTLMLYGYASAALGRSNDAEAAFRRWWSKDPGNRDAALRFAAVLADNDKAIEAERVVLAEVARRGKTADTAFLLGRALLGQARFDEAETEFREVIGAQPGHQTAQANLMELVWARTGDVREASGAIDQVLRAHPRLAWPRVTKARLLTSAGMPLDALAVIDEGLVGAGRDTALLAAAATVALECDATLSMQYATRLIDVAPNERAARVAFGNASLATGRAEVALKIADELHQTDPADGLALAMQADALRMLGDERYRMLQDYGSFVRAGLIDVPQGWSCLGDYLVDLETDLERLHTQHAHPIGNSIRGGSQVELLPGQSSSAAVRAFPRAIDGPIRNYMKALGTGTDAMRCRNTGRYDLNGMWSVRLRAKGFHVTHYHPKGWISSAFYLRVPRAVHGHHGEGWLKFGEPALATRPRLQPEYFVKPEPGLLVLFPSYLWHGTVPFAGDGNDSRLSIAFDVVPAAVG